MNESSIYVSEEQKIIPLALSTTYFVYMKSYVYREEHDAGSQIYSSIQNLFQSVSCKYNYKQITKLHSEGKKLISLKH